MSTILEFYIEKERRELINTINSAKYVSEEQKEAMIEGLLGKGTGILGRVTDADKKKAAEVAKRKSEREREQKQTMARLDREKEERHRKAEKRKAETERAKKAGQAKIKRGEGQDTSDADDRAQSARMASGGQAPATG